MKYVLLNNGTEYRSVYYINENGATVSFPFASDNTDYQTFKREVSEGVELQDPDGNVMTQEQVDDFLKTIP